MLLTTILFKVPSARQNYKFEHVTLSELITKINRDASDLQAVCNNVKTRIQYNKFRHLPRILLREVAIVNRKSTPLSDV